MYEDLKHVRRPLPEGGQVVVLETGALITAEAEAMLQALHSRSLGGIDSHLLKLAKKGAKDFMDTYYVGYGDKSIGDCGTTTIFVEGVSMLAAKAIQDFQLYNGQESSTRYIDFAKQSFIDPAATSESHALLESLRAFHLRGLAIMKEELEDRHPRQSDEEEKIWQKAINARAFDIMRAFLPAGASTNLAWHTELRHAADHLQRLRNHPLAEVKTVAGAIQEALDEKFPSSFKQKRYPATERYISDWMQDAYYFDTNNHGRELLIDHSGIDTKLLASHERILSSRPIKTEMPKIIAECGTLRFSFLLDFGSFRDLQRHRAVLQRMPLLTTKHRFENWYLEQMPDELSDMAEHFLASYKEKMQSLKLSSDEMQYYVPMGYKVPCRLTGDLPAIVWIVELRSGISVHPTLRTIAQEMGAEILSRYGQHGLRIHMDESEDRFNYKRGTQDIVEKTLAAV
jgi:thymidylate synthase ThyX